MHSAELISFYLQFVSFVRLLRLDPGEHDCCLIARVIFL